MAVNKQAGLRQEAAPAAEASAEQKQVPEASVVHKTEPVAEDRRGGAGFCMYIGPTISGVIQSGTVYRGDKRQALKTIAPAVARFPTIASLVVDGDTLAGDRMKVKTPGSLLYVDYRRLANGNG